MTLYGDSEEEEESDEDAVGSAQQQAHAMHLLQPPNLMGSGKLMVTKSLKLERRDLVVFD